MEYVLFAFILLLVLYVLGRVFVELLPYLIYIFIGGLVMIVGLVIIAGFLGD
jgi:hypothetical protein